MYTIQDDMNQVFSEFSIEYVLSVPCSILSACYRGAPGVATVFVSREEEGVGLAAGLTMSGTRSVLMIQNSGLGNALNAFASLTIPYGIGFPVVVSMRGDDREENPVQVPMGKATELLIEAIDCSWCALSSTNRFRDAFMESKFDIAKRARPFFILLPRDGGYE